MGYEIRLHVVAKTENSFDNTYLQVGSFDMCKVGVLDLDKKNAIKCNLYQNLMTDKQRELEVNDGIETDGHCSNDCYGSQIMAYPVEYVITELQRKMDNQSDYKYWRYPVAISFLKSIQTNWGWIGKPYVAIYGH